MKLLNGLKRVVPAMSAAHERIAAAVKERDASKFEFEAAHESLQRLEKIVQSASDVTREARSAKAAADAARLRWAQGGATFAAAKEHHELATAATQAAQAAELAAADASAVSKTLAAARDRLSYAQMRLRGFEAGISDAVGESVVEQAADFLERGPQLAAELRAWRVDAKALEAVVAPEERWHDQSAASKTAARIVRDALDRAEVKTWDKERDDTRGYELVHERPEPIAERLKERAAHYLARAAALLREVLNAA